MKTCPACQVEHHDAVQRCDCGHSFESRFAEPEWLAERDYQVRDKPAFELPQGSVSTDGSLIGGICLGFVCGCVGFGIAYLARMGSETKRGALYGMLISFGLGLVARVLAR